jgi:hypothetical protein
VLFGSATRASPHNTGPITLASLRMKVIHPPRVLRLLSRFRAS